MSHCRQKSPQQLNQTINLVPMLALKKSQDQSQISFLRQSKQEGKQTTIVDFEQGQESIVPADRSLNQTFVAKM
jgi:hypothetical protein